jgi:hypothetical protein
MENLHASIYVVVFVEVEVNSLHLPITIFLVYPRLLVAF